MQVLSSLLNDPSKVTDVLKCLLSWLRLDAFDVGAFSRSGLLVCLVVCSLCLHQQNYCLNALKSTDSDILDCAKDVVTELVNTSKDTSVTWAIVQQVVELRAVFASVC